MGQASGCKTEWKPMEVLIKKSYEKKAQNIFWGNVKAFRRLSLINEATGHLVSKQTTVEERDQTASEKIKWIDLYNKWTQNCHKVCDAKKTEEPKQRQSIEKVLSE
jgi:hypothetical protein